VAGLVVAPLKSIGLDEERALELLRLAALFHEIGHLPFSHGAEGVLPKEFRHEHISLAIARSLEAEVDKWFWRGASQYLALLIDPKPQNTPTEMLFLRDILSGPIDADRCDYLLRDSLHCGVAYGQFDLNWLLETITLVDFEGVRIAINKRGIHTIEALILARYYMLSQVYYHRTRRLFDIYLLQFFQRKLSHLSTMKQDDLVSVVDLDDYCVMQMLRDALVDEDTETRRLADRLYHRGGNAGKHSMIWESGEFNGYFKVKVLLNKVKELQERLPSSHLIIDCNDFKPIRIHEFYRRNDQDEGALFVVVDRDKPKLLTDESGVMERLPRHFWPVRVYAMGGEDDWPEIRCELDSVEG
jgi:HD superfamily phosphohydrolase